MNTITHALLPVIATSMGNKKPYWCRNKLLLLALFGALPDIINPHITLVARLTSWSHGLPAFLAVTVLLTILTFIKQVPLDRKLALWLGSAYLFHLCCDMISGGIAWLYPFKHGTIGDYYISPMLWIPLDIICTMVVYLIQYAVPKYKRARQKIVEEQEMKS